MNWLLEQPLWILAAGVALELVLFVVLQRTGQRWVLGAMVLVAAATAGLVGLERLIVTPAESVRSTLSQIAADLKRNDVPAVVNHISRRSPELKAEAEKRLRMVKLEDVRISQIHETTVNLDNNPPVALCRFNVVATGGDRAGVLNNQRYAAYFEVTFVKEDGAWRMRDYKEGDFREGMRGD